MTNTKQKIPESSEALQKQAGRNMSENKMGVEPISSLLFKMSIPAICSMLILSIYNIIDSIFVSRLGEDALAAVTLVFPLQMLLVAVGVGTGVGLNSLIARRLGEKRYDDANSAATHGIILVLFHSLIFAVAGYFTAHPFYAWFSDDAGLVNMAISYSRIVICIPVFMFTEVAFEKILQGTGEMIAPMISNICGCVTNIILDPILIFGLLGAPRLGVAGAAIATVTGQLVSTIVISCFMFRKTTKVRISFKNFRLSPRILKDIYSVAIPGMIMQAIPSFINIILNQILISFSVAAVSVLGVYFKLQTFVFMPLIGVGQGSMPIMGFNYGAQNRIRLVNTLKLAMKVGLCIMTAGCILFELLPHQLLSMFDASDEMMRLGTFALRVMAVNFIPAAITITFSNLFQALGHGVYSMTITLVRQLLAILPASLILSRFYGASGVWLSYPIAEVMGFVVGLFLFIRIYRKEIAPLPDGHI